MTEVQDSHGTSGNSPNAQDKPESSVCTPACPDGPEGLKAAVAGCPGLSEKVRAAILALLEAVKEGA
jgi:hypothetical protein